MYKLTPPLSLIINYITTHIPQKYINNPTLALNPALERPDKIKG